MARTIPAAFGLRAAWPGAHLAWLVEPAAASLVAAQPWVDEALVFPRPAPVGARRDRGGPIRLRELARFVARLRARRFDLVVDFHSILRSALLALATGARRRVGYARPFGRELAWALATDRARVAPARTSRFERNAALVHFLGAAAEPAARPLRVDPGAIAAMREQLGAGPAPLAIHPGTGASAPGKRVPPEVLGRVARALLAELGIPAVVTSGPARDDRRLAEAVVAASAGAARLAPPTPGLPDLAALFACARLAIGPDTGPLHLAALVGTPVVQILGPTDPIENAPWSATPSRTLRTAPARDAAGVPRLGEISAEAIAGAARELLLPAPPAERGSGTGPSP